MFLLLFGFEHRVQFYKTIYAQMYKFLVEKYIFTIFAYELFKVRMKNCKFGSKYFYPSPYDLSCCRDVKHNHNNKILLYIVVR